MIFEMHFLVSRPHILSSSAQNWKFGLHLNASLNVASEENTREYQLLSLTVYKCHVLWRFESGLDEFYPTVGNLADASYSSARKLPLPAIPGNVHFCHL